MARMVGMARVEGRWKREQAAELRHPNGRDRFVSDIWGGSRQWVGPIGFEDVLLRYFFIAYKL